jgi:hypothetical protein
MMALTQRRMTARKTTETNRNISQSEKQKTGDGLRRGLVMAILAVSLAVIATLYMGNASDGYSLLRGSSSSSSIPGTFFEIASNVKLAVDFAPLGAGGDAEVSLGTHRATLVVEKSCESPGFWLRLEGEALVGVVLHEENGGYRWTGSFELPVAGNYQMVSYWYGCDGKGSKERKVLKDIVAKGSSTTPLITSAFPSSTWISSKRFSQTPPVKQPYVWHDLSVPVEKATLLKAADTSVSQEGAVGENGFYSFKDLSNYELVCFFGSKSAEDLKSAFLRIRPIIFDHQRPFKFHMYESKNFERPDRDWKEENTKRLRKCKHILVSFDELETAMSQKEYTEQATTFINHLLKVMPDDTFPIWMFSLMQSPAEATNCHSPFLPRSSFHPCNVALKELFKSSPFPDRVRFLDSADISLPQLGENRNDILGAIALRIFVIVGKQVQTWRKNGQEGTIKGLVRGGKTEPNFELVTYTSWA